MRTPTDPDHGHHDSRMPPEATFVRAIIARAIRDLFGMPGSTTPNELALIRRDALAFLTAKAGPWARHRNDLCDLVGLDGDILAARVIRVLEGDDKNLREYDGGAELTGFEEARKMWVERKTEAPAPTKLRIVRPKTETPIDEEEMNRTESRKMIMRMLKHSPTTARELSAATGHAISARQVSAFLHHAEHQGLVERNGDVWSIALPEVAVAANSG